jgi:diguanylate cyclase (GGDEF)-like protein/PAS domain S-box-containing protein
MKTIPKEKESARLKTLYGYEILDTLPEKEFDDVAKLASQICGTPIALISLVDKERQWLKSKVGIEVDETPRDVAFCAHAIVEPEELFIVTNAERDARFENNPLVVAEPRIRFYAGAPLVTQSGEALGTLCVIDRQPRQLTEGQKDALRVLSRQVMTMLELRLQLKAKQENIAHHQRLQNLLRESEERFHAFMSNNPAVAYMKDEEGKLVYINETFERVFNMRGSLILGKTDYDYLPYETARDAVSNDKTVLSTNQAVEALETVAAPDGKLSHWQSLKFPFTNAENKRFVGGISFNVTEQVEAQEKLRRSEELYRHLFEQSQGFICLHDLDGVILSINPAAAESLGYQPDELTGVNVRELLKIEVKAEFDSYLERIGDYKIDEGIMLLETKNKEERIWKYRNLWYKPAGENPFIIGHAQDITELYGAKKKLQEISLKDELTGLLNLRGFLTLAQQAVAVARRDGRECGLIFVDIDGLKRVNDTLGHETGSQMIADTAAILKSVFQRSSDITARIGGDEFTVLIADAETMDIEALETIIQNRINDFNEGNLRPYSVAASVGAIRFQPETPDSLEEAMNQADKLMYRHKMQKKQRVAEVAAAL